MSEFNESEEKRKLRKTFERVFWDIDTNRLDFEKNHKIIITQIINYGFIEEIQALFKVYPEATISDALANPIKGVWEPKIYKAFCNLLDVDFNKKAVNILFKEKEKKVNPLFREI